MAATVKRRAGIPVLVLMKRETPAQRQVAVRIRTETAKAQILEEALREDLEADANATSRLKSTSTRLSGCRIYPCPCSEY